MKVYKFKCSCCGSTTSKKIDKNTYKCAYCGNQEHIVEETVEKIIIKEVPISENQEYVIAEKKEAFIGSLINVIIVICLGMFGVHKFIKGQIILGLIYICTYGLFGVGLFIDAIKAFRKLLRNAREYRMAKMVR